LPLSYATREHSINVENATPTYDISEASYATENVQQVGTHC